MQVSDNIQALEIVKAFSDTYSRRIVLCLLTKSLTVEEISAEKQIPVSTCYRRVRELERAGILKADNHIIWKNGKKYISYKTSFKNASIDFDLGEITVDIVPNVDPSEKLMGMWASLKDTESY